MYNSWRMDRYLNRELDSRYSDIREAKELPGKSVVDLALKAYLQENPEAKGVTTAFKDFARAQIKLFIFAGHDTTSAAAVFTFHMLSQHPHVLKQVRQEHNDVFGPNASEVGRLIKEKPHLINQLTYTLATIKETMRLYPTVAALRQGQPDFSLVDHNGQRFPTKDFIVWGDHYGMQHNLEVWPKAEEYLPERWLVDANHELYPPKNAWRPFERGPRHCIGQELALTEVRLMLAMTIREFDVQDAYDLYDEQQGKPKRQGIGGQRAYMAGRGGGHPADYYPCTVRLAQNLSP